MSHYSDFHTLYVVPHSMSKPAVKTCIAKAIMLPLSQLDGVQVFFLLYGTSKNDSAPIDTLAF